MIKFIKSFCHDEDGAITVEWVVLTAAVVGLAFLSYDQLEASNDVVLEATGEAVATAVDYLE